MPPKPSERVLALHPENKAPTRVRRDAYEAYRKAILRVVPRTKGGVAFGDIADLIDGSLPEAVASSTKALWWVTTVKLDLEARGHLERVDGVKPQHVRRTGLALRESPAEVVSGEAVGAAKKKAAKKPVKKSARKKASSGAGGESGTQVTPASLSLWLRDVPEHVSDCALALIALIREETPEATETLRTGWNTVIYLPPGASMRSGLGCAVLPQKKHVNLQFFNGVGLHAPPGLLEGTGKTARHIKVRALDDIEPKLFGRLVRDSMRS